MTEAEFQAAVIDYAQLLRWRVAHFRKAMTKRGSWVTPVAGDGKGFVDLVLVRERVLWREIKKNKGRLTKEQKAWGEALEAAGQDYGVWRPKDWDQIEKELR